MKDTLIKFFCISFLAAVPILISGCGKKTGKPSSAQLGNFKRYPWERFHLTYEYRGDVRGTEELFVSGYGKYEMHSSKYEIFSPEAIKPQNTGAITRLSDEYILNFMKNTAIHQHISPLDSLYHLNGKDAPSPQEYLENEMKRNFFRNAGADTLNGKNVTLWQQIDGGLTLSTWNCILLRKRIITPDGIFDMKIKDIDSLWTVDTSKFVVPADLKLTEATQLNASAPN